MCGTKGWRRDGSSWQGSGTQNGIHASKNCGKSSVDGFHNDPSGDHKRYATRIEEVFQAMCTQAEKNVLLPAKAVARVHGEPYETAPPDEEERNKIQTRLRHLVIAGLVDLFVRAHCKIPYGLAVNGKLPLRAPEAHVKTIRDKDSHAVPIDLRGHFQELRKKLVTEDMS